MSPLSESLASNRLTLQQASIRIKVSFSEANNNTASPADVALYSHYSRLCNSTDSPEKSSADKTEP